MKTTKIKQFEIYNVEANTAESEEMKNFLSYIKKEDLISVKTDIKNYTYSTSIVTVVYQEND